MAKQETIDDRKKRAGAILRGLRNLYPDADCALHHSSPLELLIATILSAQSTDETVNRVTPVLFKKYPTPEALAAAPASEVEQVVKSTGFFRQKTKSIQGVCRAIVAEHGGHVPDSMDDLIKLPGVARKTANVVLGTWFGKNEGMVVDTHVGRLAVRMALTWNARNEKDAVKIENDLLQLIPRKDWTFFGHAMIWHGRRVCTARKPNCAGCGVAKHCPSAFTFAPADAVKAAKGAARKKRSTRPR
jgi:endonuclease-3